MPGKNPHLAAQASDSANPFIEDGLHPDRITSFPLDYKPINYLSINGQTLSRNTRLNENTPPIRIASSKYGKAEYGSDVVICDEAGNEVGRLIYDPNRAIMGCGARLVLVTRHPVKIK